MSFQDSASRSQKLDFYPTPPWVTRILLKELISPEGVVWDPACGDSSMSNVLRESGLSVVESDVIQYGEHEVADFLQTSKSVDWIITNPPYFLLNKFIAHACSICKNVAFFVRLGALESKRRHALFEAFRPSVVGVFSERPGMFPGKVIDIGSGHGSCWIVWQQPSTETKLIFLPPSKRDLEQPGDYSIVTAKDLEQNPSWKKYFK